MSAIAIAMGIVAPLFLRGRAGRAGLLHSDFGAIMLHLKNQKKKSANGAGRRKAFYGVQVQDM